MSELSVMETLIAARKKIEDEDHWAQGDYALDLQGKPVGQNSKNAHSRCMAGAICSTLRISTKLLTRSKAYQFIDNEVAQTGCLLPDFNDSHTHAEVLGLFDIAIDKAKNSDW